MWRVGDLGCHGDRHDASLPGSFARTVSRHQVLWLTARRTSSVSRLVVRVDRGCGGDGRGAWQSLW